ncbi:hypothetical protein GF312_08175 [Candidatus Poribacteria bacterium]|nr:hypothetical protein [Candidatus Poribacteria bacterium]
MFNFLQNIVLENMIQEVKTALNQNNKNDIEKSFISFLAKEQRINKDILSPAPNESLKIEVIQPRSEKHSSRLLLANVDHKQLNAGKTFKFNHFQDKLKFSETSKAVEIPIDTPLEKVKKGDISLFEGEKRIVSLLDDEKIFKPQEKGKMEIGYLIKNEAAIHKNIISQQTREIQTDIIEYEPRKIEYEYIIFTENSVKPKFNLKVNTVIDDNQEGIIVNSKDDIDLSSKVKMVTAENPQIPNIDKKSEKSNLLLEINPEVHNNIMEKSLNIQGQEDTSASDRNFLSERLIEDFAIPERQISGLHFADPEIPLEENSPGVLEVPDTPEIPIDTSLQSGERNILSLEERVKSLEEREMRIDPLKETEEIAESIKKRGKTVKSLNKGKIKVGSLEKRRNEIGQEENEIPLFTQNEEVEIANADLDLFNTRINQNNLEIIMDDERVKPYSIIVSSEAHGSEKNTQEEELVIEDSESHPYNRDENIAKSSDIQLEFARFSDNSIKLEQVPLNIISDDNSIVKSQWENRQDVIHSIEFLNDANNGNIKDNPVDENTEAVKLTAKEDIPPFFHQSERILKKENTVIIQKDETLINPVDNPNKPTEQMDFNFKIDTDKREITGIIRKPFDEGMTFTKENIIPVVEKEIGDIPRPKYENFSVNNNFMIEPENQKTNKTTANNMPFAEKPDPPPITEKNSDTGYKLDYLGTDKPVESNKEFLVNDKKIKAVSGQMGQTEKHFDAKLKNENVTNAKNKTIMEQASYELKTDDSGDFIEGDIEVSKIMETIPDKEQKNSEITWKSHVPENFAKPLLDNKEIAKSTKITLLSQSRKKADRHIVSTEVKINDGRVLTEENKGLNVKKMDNKVWDIKKIEHISWNTEKAGNIDLNFERWENISEAEKYVKPIKTDNKEDTTKVNNGEIPETVFAEITKTERLSKIYISLNEKMIRERNIDNNSSKIASVIIKDNTGKTMENNSEISIDDLAPELEISERDIISHTHIEIVKTKDRLPVHNDLKAIDEIIKNIISKKEQLPYIPMAFGVLPVESTRKNEVVSISQDTTWKKTKISNPEYTTLVNHERKITVDDSSEMTLPANYNYVRKDFQQFRPVFQTAYPNAEDTEAFMEFIPDEKESPELINNLIMENIINIPQGHQTHIQELPIERQIHMISSLAELPDKISTQLRNMSSGSSTMTIQLEPERLGKIKFKATLEGKKMTAELKVERLETKELIEFEIPNIIKTLASQDVEVSEIRVSLQNKSAGSESREWNFSRSSTNREMLANHEQGSEGRQRENQEFSRRRYYMGETLVDMFI